ncbi:MAG: PEP-CTERM sorting domain-containing protein [Thermodesulfobacteriota bacterium]|nr:PEP-CTERM sorting domain-containing protein [Thermodesulfobacteriota bacterium]
MRRLVLILATVLITLTFSSGSALALTTPYYSYSEIYAFGGAGAVGFSDPDHQTAEGAGTTSLTGASGPRSGGTASWIGAAADGYARITADPANGNISAYTAADHEAGVAGWEISWLPGTPYSEPDTWGSASAFGYIRSVWQVVSTDPDLLQSGDPVTINATLAVDGWFDEDLESGVRATLLLNDMEDASWLESQEYLTWGGFEDLGLGSPLYLSTTNADGTNVDYTGSLSSNVSVGDIVVMETLFSIYSVLDNDGILRVTWADFENTLNSSISTTTPGASLVPYGAAPQTAVPEPSTMILLGSGLAGIIGFGKKRLFKKA